LELFRDVLYGQIDLHWTKKTFWGKDGYGAMEKMLFGKGALLLDRKHPRFMV
jgi:hypothetical protein